MEQVGHETRDLDSHLDSSTADDVDRNQQN